LTYERGTSVYGIVNELFRNHGIWPIRLTSSNSVAAILDLAQSGVGICVVPGPVAKPLVGTGRLKFLRCETPLPKVDFYVAHTTQPYNEMGAAVAGIIVNLAKASRGAS
jgi:DNA-binding transcriptional LysR family regulator